MESIDRDALGAWPILLSEDGFPGELSRSDAHRARVLIETSDVDAVVVAAGAGVFWLVDGSSERTMAFVGGDTGGDSGFALGTGDGATLPGVPVDWDLLTFTCPQCDMTVLVAQYPNPLPRCTTHGVALELADAGQ